MNGLIKYLNFSNLESIINIERKSYSSPWPPHVFLEEMRCEWSRMWGVFPPDSKDPVGFILFWEIYDELHILNLAVHPSFRRRGYAKQMMSLLLDYGRAKNFKLATLEVRPSNTPALKLYMQLGFKVVGIRKGYYSDNNEDALMMANILKEEKEEDTSFPQMMRSQK